MYKRQAQGVKTNVLFLTRGATDRGNTQGVWVYDLRSNMPAFGKTRPLTVADFEPFEAAYGDNPKRRTDQGPEGRFRFFSRADITARNDSLDIAWLPDDSNAAEDDLSDPEDIAAAILGHLRAALIEVEAVDAELAAEEAVPVEVAA